MADKETKEPTPVGNERQREVAAAIAATITKKDKSKAEVEKEKQENAALAKEKGNEAEVTLDPEQIAEIARVINHPHQHADVKVTGSGTSTAPK